MSHAGPAGPMPTSFPDRKETIVITLIVLTIISTTFALWRLAVTLTSNRRFMVCDYLLIVAAGLNISANIFSVLSAYNGQGRHMKDPSITPTMLLTSAKYMYFSQAMNVLSMAFLKASISAYLVSLKFSTAYRYIIWCTIVIVALTNFILPCIVLFGNCRPISLRWNKKQKGTCWPKAVNAASGYTQSASNILTDVIYCAAPIVYLATVQLKKRTQWGLRAVFLLGLCGTACSIAKLFDLRVLAKSGDFTYDSVNLTIWSAAEVSTGIIVSCLPILRKTFEKLLRRVIPGSTIGGSKGTPKATQQSYELSKGSRGTPAQTALDDDSERGIMDGESSGDEKGDEEIARITKTTRVTVERSERGVGAPWNVGYQAPSFEALPQMSAQSRQMYGVQMQPQPQQQRGFVYQDSWRDPVGRAV